MNRRRVIFYAIFDVVAALLVWLLFYFYRRITNDMVLFGDKIEYFFVPDYSLLPSAISFPIVALFIHYLTGFYNEKVRRSRIVELFSTLIGTFFISTIIYFGMLVDDIVVSYTFYYRSFLILWGLFFVVTYLFRIVQTTVVLSKLRKGLIPNNVLIVGTGDTAKKVTEIISKDSYRTGQKIVGYIAVRDRIVVDESMVLGRLDILENEVKTRKANEVIIAVDNMDNDMIFAIANRLIVCGVEVKFAPRLFEVVTGHVSFTNVTSEPLVDITSSRMPAWQQSVKRVFDVGVSFVCMIILLPVYAYVAIAMLGIGYSLVPSAMWPSVPKIIPEKLLGSAYALIFWVQNIGLCLVPMLIGTLRVSTNGYVVPMIVFASFGVLAFLLSLALKVEDKKKGYGLELPNKK